MRIQKDKQTLEVTEKAYRVVYAPMGFTPVEGGATNGKGKAKPSNKRRQAAEKEPQEEGAQIPEEVGESDGE